MRVVSECYLYLGYPSQEELSIYLDGEIITNLDITGQWACQTSMHFACSKQIRFEQLLTAASKLNACIAVFLITVDGS